MPGTGRREAFALVGGADRVGGESLAAAGLLDVAEAEFTLRYGDVEAVEVLDVPPATLDLAINPWKKGRDVGVAAAVARILVVEDRARVRGGADEGEGEDDVLEHLGRCEGNRL